MLRLQPSFGDSVEASHPQMSKINDSLYPSDWAETIHPRYHHSRHHDLCSHLDRTELGFRNLCCIPFAGTNGNLVDYDDLPICHGSCCAQGTSLGPDDWPATCRPGAGYVAQFSDSRIPRLADSASAWNQ